MRVALEIERLVLGAKQRGQVGIAQTLLAQQRRQRVHGMDRVDDQRGIIGHMLAVERVFVGRHGEQHLAPGAADKGVRQGQIVGGVVQLARGHPVGTEIVGQRGGIVEPVLAADDHTRRGRGAKNAGLKERIGVYELIAKGEVLVEIGLELPEKVQIQPALPVHDRGEGGERPVFRALRGRMYAHGGEGDQADEETACDKNRVKPFHDVPPLQNRK